MVLRGRDGAPDLRLHGTASREGASHDVSREDDGQLWRDANGALRYTPGLYSDKLKISVSLEDIRPPGLDRARRGQTFTVEAPVQLLVDDNATPSYPVAESWTVADPDGDLTAYRPEVVMMLTGIEDAQDEHQARSRVRLTLEEV